MFNGPANLRKFHRRKRDNGITLQTLRNGIELRHDLHLSMRKLTNLSPFGSLSHGVFFSVDPFFRRRGPMNFTGAVSGNTRFHVRKSVLS